MRFGEFLKYLIILTLLLIAFVAIAR